MTVTISPPMFTQFLNPNNSGAPAAGFKLFTYAAGTNIKQATWIDSTQVTQNANPIILDASGGGYVWGDPTLAYKFVWAPANDTDPPSSPIRSVDNIYFPLSVTVLSQGFIGGLLYPRTVAENSASVIPSNYAYPPGNVLRYGADPTNNNDSSSAFVNATASGYVAYAPTGSYRVSSNITLAAGGIIGDGAYLTRIFTTDTGSSDVFKYTGALAGRFENFQIQPVSTKAGGYAITVGPTSGEVSGMRFFQIVINAMPNCINSVASSLWSMTACNFYGYTGNAILVNNTNNADSGDSIIQGCQFTSPGNTVANAIQQVASSGLKVIGNKFNSAGVGVLLNLATGDTSDLIIVGNSFENAHISNIQLQRQGGSTAIFENIVITGNQFLCNSSSGNSSAVFSNNGSIFLYKVVVCGNTIKVLDTAAATAILLDYVTDALISGNTIRGSGGAGTFGVFLGTHNINITIGVNNIIGFGNNINAPTTTNVVASNFQTATSAVTTSTAYGSLFNGSAVITFPVAFCTDFPPIIQNCSVFVTGFTGGGICAEVTAVSSTQLSVNVVGITNGGSVPIRWSVVGVT